MTKPILLNKLSLPHSFPSLNQSDNSMLFVQINIVDGDQMAFLEIKISSTKFCDLLLPKVECFRSGILQPFQNCSGTVIMDICEEFYSSQSCSVVVDDFLQSHEYQVRTVTLNIFIPSTPQTL